MAQAYLSDARYTERLQISLSPNLKAVAKKLSKLKKMSLSELFRYLLLVEAGEVKKIKQNYNQIIDDSAGAVSVENHPEWKDRQSVGKWMKKTRTDFERQF